MFHRYRAHLRGQPERKFWMAELLAEPLVGTEEEIREQLKTNVLARGQFPSDEPTQWLSKSEANWIASRYKDAVIVIEGNDLVASFKGLFSR